MKNHIKKSIVTVVLLAGLMLTGCAKTAPATRSSVTSEVKVECEWEKINEAIGSYKFGDKYFLDEEYKDDEKTLNSVYVYNFDPDEPKAFKNVPYQIMLIYGQADGYTVPVITISLVDNKSKATYSAYLDKSGTKMSEEGTWFPNEDKDVKIKALADDATEIFGLG